MLIAKCILKENDVYASHLCLIPHAASQDFPPVKVSLLDQTDGPVFWVGPGESVKVEISSGENARIIAALRPAILFITAPTGDQPGIKVPAVKVIYKDNGSEEMHYQSTTGEWKQFFAKDER